MDKDTLKRLEEAFSGNGQPLDIVWGPSLEFNSPVIKKWGNYTDILRLDYIVVKQLVINGGQKISNQKHYHRKETWIVLEGNGEVRLDSGNSGLSMTLQPGTKFVVEPETWHQVKANEESILYILEIQEGESCREDDIERKEDVL